MTKKGIAGGVLAVVIMWVVIALLIFDTERSGFYAFVGIIGLVASSVAFMFGAAMTGDI